jgi:hypothetical protein
MAYAELSLGARYRVPGMTEPGRLAVLHAVRGGPPAAAPCMLACMTLAPSLTKPRDDEGGSKSFPAHGRPCIGTFPNEASPIQLGTPIQLGSPIQPGTPLAPRLLARLAPQAPCPTSPRPHARLVPCGWPSAPSGPFVGGRTCAAAPPTTRGRGRMRTRGRGRETRPAAMLSADADARRRVRQRQQGAARLTPSAASGYAECGRGRASPSAAETAGSSTTDAECGQRLC